VASRAEVRLYNEDCVQGCRKHIAGGSIDLVITDPPYGIDGHKLHQHYNRKEGFVVDGYVEIPRERYAAFTRSWMREADRILRPGGSAYIFSGWTNLRDLLNALAETSLQLTNHVIWKYNFGVFTRKKFVTSHYHILYLMKPGGKVTFNRFSRFGSNERDQNGGSQQYQDMEDVWMINREYKPGKEKNKNELPTELLVKILQYSSRPGDSVCDLFLGGFSTARIARGMGCSVYGFEVNPTAFEKYVASVKRVKPGELLSKVRRGAADDPPNAGKPWTPQEDRELAEMYRKLLAENGTKKQAVAQLCEHFGRGRFAILKALSRLDVS
jgi:site-specific DNA-methyltransferase (adenine-specific)